MANLIADYIVSKIQFSTKVEMIMFASISVAIVLLLLILWFIVESTKEEIILESPTYPEEDLSAFQKVLNERKEKESIAGSTSKYDWTQNEQEVDIYIPIQEYSKGCVGKLDIRIDIKTSFITVVIAGETILNDTFFAAVVPDECNWQIEDIENSNRRIWINIFKRIPTTRQNHWQYILNGDKDMKKTKPSILPIYDRNIEDTKEVDRNLSKME